MVRLSGMKRASFSVSNLSRRPGVAGLALLAVLGCSEAGEADDTPDFMPPIQGGSSSTSPQAGVGGSTTPGVGVGGTTGTGAVGNSSEGQGGSVPLGTGGTGAGVGAAGSPAAMGGAGGTAAGAGGTAAGSGGSGNPSGAGPGRVGAELCPPGPFGNPLAGGVTVQPLASVGDNNFFLFEGPVWTGDALYLSEIGNDDTSQIDRYTLDGTFTRGVFRDTGSNGLALDANGDLLLAAHDVGGISRLALPEGTITRGAQQLNGLRFNSPNDLVLRGDGNIYFTDPDFQSPTNARIQPGTFVYRIAPPEASGAISIVDQTVDNPNGVTLSPDGNTLYVSANGVLRKYSLDAAGVATPAGDLVPGFNGPDGMAMDCAGNIYAVKNGEQTITVLSPDGQQLGVIGPAGFAGGGVTNAAFGGPNRTTLFVTTFSQGTTGGLFSVELGVPGLPY
jgi:gluconolactonase